MSRSKKCSRCERVKWIGSFYKRGTRHTTMCKPCHDASHSDKPGYKAPPPPDETATKAAEARMDASIKVAGATKQVRILLAIHEGARTPSKLCSVMRDTSRSISANLQHLRTKGFAEVVDTIKARASSPFAPRAQQPMNVWGLTKSGREELARWIGE
jgi:hypothetical protein